MAAFGRRLRALQADIRGAAAFPALFGFRARGRSVRGLLETLSFGQVAEVVFEVDLLLVAPLLRMPARCLPLARLDPQLRAQHGFLAYRELAALPVVRPIRRGVIGDIQHLLWKSCSGADVSRALIRLVKLGMVGTAGPRRASEKWAGGPKGPSSGSARPYSLPLNSRRRG